MELTSYEFEVVAKNAVADMIDGVTLQDLQLVWFTHVLGDKKCCVWAPSMKNKYAEVTYSREGIMWIDIYEKIDKKELLPNEFNFIVKSIPPHSYVKQID